ncbi:MAG: glycosyltransferase family 2 protein, partial [Acidimicrobiia bacterium]
PQYYANAGTSRVAAAAWSQQALFFGPIARGKDAHRSMICCGTNVLFRRAALDDVGGWDERYFMYVEDVDLCWRLRGAGWRVAYEPGAVVEHLLGVSTAGAPYRMITEHHRSLYRFATRRFSGRKRALLPAAAGFLGLRAVLAMGHHKAGVLRSRRTPAPMANR